ncbi:MAG: tetraacyldisaccharide 4'-kinase [Phycisphaerae bacterium]|jgi:tetraacyldisaccharide 4'-kinase
MSGPHDVPHHVKMATHDSMAMQAKPPVAGAAGRAMAWVYGKVIAHRNASFDRGKGVVTFDRPVISVGNLSVGGTGKTPVTMWLLQLLRREGYWPCVAMRGYGMPKGRGLESDEAREYLSAFSDLPIVAQPDRTQGLLELFSDEFEQRQVSDSSYEPVGERRASDIVVLDDGFQHRQIARQLDIVLIDATRDPFADRLLPSGFLRELPASLARAHAVVLTHAEAVAAHELTKLAARVQAISKRLVVASCRHHWAGLKRSVAGGQADEQLAVTSLRDKKVLAVCAIGNPDAFVQSVRQHAGGLAEAMVLPDHDPYEPATVQRIIDVAKRSGAQVIVCTQKDWSKLARVAATTWPCAVVRPVLEVQMVAGEDALRPMILGAAATEKL